MDTLKLELTTAPVLKLPYSGSHLILDTDVHSVLVGCVLRRNQPEYTTVDIVS